jgi:hypothetical protein
LYRYGYGYGKHLIGARITGHQLFYDLTRLVTDVAAPGGRLIRGVRRGKDWARRGFSLKLCDCPYEDCGFHPRLRVVKLGRFKHRYAFEKAPLPQKGGHGFRTRRYLGRFLDTIPFGLALRKGRSASLEAMGDTFRARVRKRERPDFAGPYTEETVEYLVGDVQATYWLGVAELADYQQHGVSRKPEANFSSASLTKGYLQDFGFPPARERTWHLDWPDLPEQSDTVHNIEGVAMTTYFGGRTEVHHRLDPVEVLHVDFKSAYVAINHLLGLQALWLAKAVTIRDCTEEVRDWLAARTPAELLADLQRPGVWPRLCILVKFTPDGRLTLPWRGDHTQRQGRPGAGTLNIGQQYVRADTPRWYTLADLVAAIIRDEALPVIEQALTFVPSYERVATKPLEVFGQVIDPRREVVWTAFINRRRALKKAAAAARAAGRLDEAARLDGQQSALKEIALAGSYGVLEELNEKVYEGQALAIDVYALGHTRRYGNVIEEPGPYYAGMLGSLIPAGARLLLAICERLLRDQGMSYAFMDTDSATPIRPKDAQGAPIDRQDFERRVQTVVDWFVPLNPFEEGGSLLDYEDQNYPIDPANPNTVDKRRFEPLWCLAVSAKRYVECNRWQDADGRWQPVVRKFTSHGLGAWGRRDQGGYALPAYMPPPHTFREAKDRDGHVLTDAHGDPVRIPDAAPLGGPLWVYRLQWDFAYTLLNDRYPNGEPLYRDEQGVPWYFPRYDEWLDTPAFYPFSVESWADYARMRHLPGLRPGNFLTVYPRPTGTTSASEVADTLTRVVIGRQPITRGDIILGAGKRAEADVADHHPEVVAEQLDAVIQEELLSHTSEALYSPYVTSGAAARQVLAAGQIRRIKDDAVVPVDTELKSMLEVVRPYFTHREEKAANPEGVGELARRHIHDIGDDVIGTESNRLAAAAAQDTGDVIGGREQGGGRAYGPAERQRTGAAMGPASNGATQERRRQLASLFDEAMPDLLAASCLSRKTVERVAHADYEPLPEVLAALECAMQLLDPKHPESIAGWRDVLTAEALAAVVDPSAEDTPEDTQQEIRLATPAEREREIAAEHRARLEERERAWMDREAMRLARAERAEVVRILRRAGGVRVSIDHATGRTINHGEWALLPASVRRREGRLTMDQAMADVMAELPALGWEVPDDLVEYFERAHTRELHRQNHRPANRQDALEDARDRLRGRKTWTEAERARLVCFMRERHERVTAHPG